MDSESLSYSGAGVDIEAGNETVRRIKDDVRSTYRPGVLGDIGGFGGLFALAAHKYKEPVLVSGTDGVGTKLRLAFMTGRHDTIGIDAVAMCVNDVLAQGAEPLFFLDYLAVGKLEPGQAAQVVAGVAAGCRESGCALIGGETAEMPGFYAPGEYDVAGFCVGVAERSRLLPSRDMAEGDALIGLASSGLHSNGFSLARQICFGRQGLKVGDYVPELGRTLGEELLTPTRLYPRHVLPLLAKHHIKGLVHITGGGYQDNLPRVLPEGLEAWVDPAKWDIPPIFGLLQKWGRVEAAEMFRTFNMGLGLVLVADPAEAGAIMADLAAAPFKSYLIGALRKGGRRAVIEGVQ